METLASKRKKYFKECLKEVGISFIFAPVLTLYLFLVDDLSINKVLIWMLFFVVVYLYKVWVIDRKGYYPLEFTFNEDNIEIIVTRVFFVRRIRLSPGECRIKRITYNKENKKKYSSIRLYPSGKSLRGYVMWIPLWTYEEQMSILNSLTKYDEIKIDTIIF